MMHIGKQRGYISVKAAWTVVAMVAALVLGGCGGPNGISIGVFGGSGGHTGVGMGVGFPIGGRSSGDGREQAQTTSTHTPFVVGEVVAENDLYYRRFLGVTPQGRFVVQDFYKRTQNQGAQEHARADSKLTDAYVLIRVEDVQGLLCSENAQMGNELSVEMLEWLGRLNGDGVFVLWFDNGQKALQTYYENRHLNGPWSQWFVSGGKQYSGNFVQGARAGAWVRWNDQGVLVEENDYGAGAQL